MINYKYDNGFFLYQVQLPSDLAILKRIFNIAIYPVREAQRTCFTQENEYNDARNYET